MQRVVCGLWRNAETGRLFGHSVCAAVCVSKSGRRPLRHSPCGPNVSSAVCKGCAIPWLAARWPDMPALCGRVRVWGSTKGSHPRAACAPRFVPTILSFQILPFLRFLISRCAERAPETGPEHAAVDAGLVAHTARLVQLVFHRDMSAFMLLVGDLCQLVQHSVYMVELAKVRLVHHAVCSFCKQMLCVS